MATLVDKTVMLNIRMSPCLWWWMYVQANCSMYLLEIRWALSLQAALEHHLL